MSGSLWLKMNERQCDFALLREFARDGRQTAFTTLVRRHLDLVYATALRKADDAGGAEEIAQNVFSALARKAWQFAPDDSLPAWLYKTALLESKSWLRGELRRRRREQAAAELGTTMKTPDDQAAFNALVPMLDDALLSLREKDRTAVLLRFYESHSLREVGAALGVSEDTAQKRVEGALEQVAQFFKRQGYKTATVAAAAAALQHTAASASAGLVSTVVGAALQAAPPALVGLGAWLARLASLSKGQTACLCVALMVAPLAWQLIEQKAAAQEARRMQNQLLTALDEHARAQAEIEGLRADSANLEQSLARAKEAAARAAESNRAFEVWKKKTLAGSKADGYRWSDESPFVRIPKSVLPAVCAQTSDSWFSGPGLIAPSLREVLGLSPSETQTLEEALHRHYAETDNLISAGIQESNLPVHDNVLAGKAYFTTSLLKDQTDQVVTNTLADIRNVLGPERWSVLQEKESGTSFSSSGGTNLLGLRQSMVDYMNQAQRGVSVMIQPDETGNLKIVGLIQGPVIGYFNDKLSRFLPDGNPNKPKNDGTKTSLENYASYLPSAMRERASAWLREEAVARLGEGATK